MAILQVLSTLAVAWLSIASAYPAAEVAPAEVALPEATNGTLSKRYNDGQGTYVASDQVHHYASGDKCWRDWYLVSQTVEWGPWYPASNKVYCSGTSMCQVSKMTGTQNCETWSVSVDVGIETKVIKLGVSLGYDLQKCHSAQDTTSCTWNDGQCHIIWAQQQFVAQRGYTRGRCHKRGNKIGDDWIAWMKDWEHKAPTSLINYGCGSKCSNSP